MEPSPDVGATILVVDDELTLRLGIERALRSLGHSVDGAGDMSTARDRIRQQRFDLALLDVMMPDGSGVDLIAALQEKDPDTICIIITGFATVELAVNAIKHGAYDFLSKPFTSDELIVAVNQGLERRRLSLEAQRLAAIEMEAQELARAKAELEKLDQAKSQLMLRVAHELRAPTAAVQSYVNLIQGGYVPQAELSYTLGRVQNRLQQMLDLVSDLLELAHLRQVGSRATDRASPQSMAEVLEEVAELFKPQAQAKSQTLSAQIADRPMVLARREHLEQLWNNLISNALKYSPNGGAVSVTLRTETGHLVGTVEDSGIGIAKEDLPNLFQEFYRTVQAKATGEIGTGLGLSIVKQIIDLYHGEIRVDSELGRGTRVTFTLPLDPASVAGQA